MAGSGSNPSDIFNVRKIRGLVELMREYDLSEIDLRQSDQRIQLKRGGELKMSGFAPPVALPATTPVPPARSAVAPAAPEPATTTAEADSEGIVFVKSPMVGTFYIKANPDTEPFASVGDHINAETTVCIIEAMKVFNEIPADVSGQIVAVLVENEEPVEFGRPLFKVKTGG